MMALQRRQLAPRIAALGLAAALLVLVGPRPGAAEPVASGLTVRAPDVATPRPWTVAWSVAPASIGIVELAGDRALQQRWLARVVVALGHGTTQFWSTRQIRGLTMIEGQWIAQLGAQLRRAVVGDVARGLFLGADARFLTIRRPLQPVTGGALGLVGGARWTFDSGLMLELGGGGVVVVSTLLQRGTDVRVASWSVQGQANGLVGWSF